MITSPSGAAIRDILHVLKRRAPSIPVLIFPTPVQGAEAPAQIRAALERATARGDCDVLVIGRGGGSLEDLWAFNDEALVRAVAASPVPVVSAVGHEVDVALTDFAADVRAPTPSAAAELISPDGETLLSRLSVLARRQRQFMGLALRGQRQRLEGLTRRLQARHPERQLEQTRQLVDEQQARLARALRQRLALLQSRWRPLDVRLRQQSPAQQVTRQAQRLAELRRRLPVPLTHQQRHLAQRLSGLGHRLNTASPLATLDRGYSLTLVEGSRCGRWRASRKARPWRRGWPRVLSKPPSPALNRRSKSARSPTVGATSVAIATPEACPSAGSRLKPLLQRRVAITTVGPTPGPRLRRREEAAEQVGEEVAAERLGQVGVHAGGEAALAFLEHGVGGERHDGHRVAAVLPLPAAQGAGGFQAVHDRHLHVHENAVEVLLPARARALAPSPAVATSRPRCSSMRRATSRFTSLSSTSSTRPRSRSGRRSR